MSESKYKKWLSLQQQLVQIKAKELMLRKELCADLFDGEHGEFTINKETRNLIVVATSKVTRSIDNEALSTMMADLSDSEKECINFKPSLDTRKWRKLPEDCLLNQAIVEKPATPTLSVEVKIK